jgi:hypothetical protein
VNSVRWSRIDSDPGPVRDVGCGARATKGVEVENISFAADDSTSTPRRDSSSCIVGSMSSIRVT